MADPALTPQQRAIQQLTAFLPNFAQAQASTMPAAPPTTVPAKPAIAAPVAPISGASGDWTVAPKPAFPSAPALPVTPPVAAPVAATPPAAGTPAAFASTYGAAAQRAGEKLGVDANTLLAQWGLETGWGKSVIPGTNNLGNIKDFSGTGTAATDNMTGGTDKYMKFADANAFADHYAGLISRKYPEAIGAGSDAGVFANALAARGYAQDPNYASKIQGAYGTLIGTPTVAATPGTGVTQGLPGLAPHGTSAASTTLQSPHYLDENGNEDVFRTAQGHQIVYTGQGPIVDGVLTPHSVIAAGMVPQFLHAASQGSVTDADKTSVSNAQATALEAQKSASAGNVANIGAAAQTESHRIAAKSAEDIEASRAADVRKNGTPIYEDALNDPLYPALGSHKVFKGMVQVGADGNPKFTPAGGAEKAVPKVGDGYNAPDGTYGKYKVKDKKIVGVN